MIDSIGVPFNSAGATDGVAAGPAALRNAGLVPRLQRNRTATHDLGDVDIGTPSPTRDSASGLVFMASLTTMTTAARDAVRPAVRDGHFPVVLDGDCPVLLGALTAAQDEHDDISMLFVDGHQGAWPWGTTATACPQSWSRSYPSSTQTTWSPSVHATTPTSLSITSTRSPRPSRSPRASSGAGGPDLRPKPRCGGSGRRVGRGGCTWTSTYCPRTPCLRWTTPSPAAWTGPAWPLSPTPGWAPGASG